MGDRCAKWAFAFCAIDIDMDPLPIAGAARELIDAVLTDRNPFRYAQRTADKLRHRRHTVVGDCHGIRCFSGEWAEIFAQNFADGGLW